MIYFQRLTGVLLQQQQHVERLNDKSKEIVPLKYRRELPDFPVKVKSLLSFTHGDVSVMIELFPLILS